MKGMTIARQIMLMIGISIIALLMVGITGLLVSNTQTKGIHTIDEESLTSIQTLGAARQAFMSVRVKVYAHVLNVDEMEKLEIENSLASDAKQVEQLLKEYEKHLLNDEDKKLLETDNSTLNAYLDLINKEVLPKSRNKETEAARDTLLSQGSALGGQALNSLDAHMAYHKKKADETVARALAGAAQGKIITLAAILMGSIALGALGLYLLRNISRSLNQIRTMVSRVESDLDFTLRVTVTKQDEIGVTTSALNRLLDKLQGNLQSISSGAKSVAAAATQMAATSSQVATASQQQSEAASGMAATVEEMTVSINHVSDRAQEANRISSQSGQLAASGEKIIGQTASDIHDIAATVHQAAEQIHGLEQHGQQISNVVAVIKEVADQTNLLALNAAIEAARAGEQGRGFAVVADEVRKLAERTAASTQEIAATINTMRASASNAVASMQEVVSKVALGVERAQQANESIKQIGQGSRDAVDMVDEIATAISEQGSATNNIAVQVERIAQMSEESNAAAEESARSAHDLDRLASDMQRIVSAYRL
ncbi:MAG: HAMP domain-containing methyl-accepting chemotaxis protein [Formivibrio sp.]|nr:HAMP domain-containing methyl-accepting chemotaxis protein [Formivibrio sp.]